MNVQIIPYKAIMDSLELQSIRDIEDIIIETMYLVMPKRTLCLLGLYFIV